MLFHLKREASKYHKVFVEIESFLTNNRYQGILGSCIGLGNVIGPFLAAAFVQSTSWRYIFYLITGLALLAAIVILLILPPSNMPKDDLKTKLRKIDYLGILTSSVAIILLLIPISGIGSYFTASSAMVVSMLAIGSVAAILFILTEWKVAKLPMMPRTPSSVEDFLHSHSLTSDSAIVYDYSPHRNVSTEYTDWHHFLWHLVLYACLLPNDQTMDRCEIRGSDCPAGSIPSYCFIVGWVLHFKEEGVW
jgi:hypothetical protein